MGSLVIDFSPEGTAQAMHRDAFPLGFLGKQTIERASEIVFDEDTQLWDIKLPFARYGGAFMTHPGARDFHGYDEARRVEVAWLDGCRLAGVSPFSEEGSNILSEIRK